MDVRRATRTAAESVGAAIGRACRAAVAFFARPSMFLLCASLLLVGVARHPLAESLQVAPTQPQGVRSSGHVSGRIVDSDGEGIPNAVVTLLGGVSGISIRANARDSSGVPRRTVTALNGSFVFYDVPPGRYTFEAAKAGYLSGAYGRLRPDGQLQSAEVKANEILALRITVWECGSVHGTVRDEFGEGLVGVQVRARRQSAADGRLQWVDVSAGPRNTIET